MTKNNSLDPRGRAQRRCAIFQHKVEKYLAKGAIDDKHRKIIRSLLGTEGRSSLLLLSDLQARLEASDKFSSLLLSQSNAHPLRQYFFFTFTDQSGLVSDRATIIDVTGMLHKAGRALRALNMNAVAVLEVHPLANFPNGGAGRTLMFHVHAIGWADGPFDYREAEQSLIAGGAWTNALGAPPVKIKPITPDAEDLEVVARYCLKAPHAAKNRVPGRRNPTQFRLMNTLKGYRPEFAVRVLEVLSQIEMLDAVIGIGDGKRLRQAFRKAMMDWHRTRERDENDLPGEFDIWHFWLTFRQTVGSKLYLPVRIVGGGYRMRIVKHPLPTQRMRRGLSLPKWKRAGKPGNRVPRRRKKA